MTTLTFHGGVGEIGGNKILLESSKAKIWFDFGLSFSKMGQYYAEFLQPRKQNGIGDYIEMGIMPWIKGLYRNDYVKEAGLPTSKCLFDGVFLSHPHADHFGNMNLLHKDMPFYMGECAKTFVEAYEKTGMQNDYVEFREAFTGLHHTKNPKTLRPISTFRTNAKITVKDVDVYPVHVDHSIPGAYGFIASCPDVNIAYTGDIRLHGPKGSMTKDFVAKAKSFDPDVLVIEGTRMTGTMNTTEEDVLKSVTKMISDTPGLVVGNFPARDIDRFMTFYDASVANGRKLLIDLKQAYLLDKLEDDPIRTPALNDKNIIVYYRKKLLEKTWEKELLSHCKNLVEATEIDQKRSVMYCSSFGMGELIDVQPIPKSSYIYSMCSPFNEEMAIDYKRLMNWVDHFKLKYYQAHASGHASPEELKWVIDEIGAKKIIPVHTEAQENFKGISSNVIFPKKGNKVKL
ncbi:MAG: hypothetical protein NT001_03955 [Candidatus Woesearchaeota archaeon]|nr:hypothetical protein [Candidatus Woesearchaeota archaeon]